MVKAAVLKLGGRADIVSAFARDDEQELKVSEELRRELVNFGLTPNEARILIHLSRHGPLKARDVAETLGIHRTETYHLLTHLQNQGLVSATFQHPIKFAAVNFEKALSILIELERERLLTVERRKSELCNLWETLPKGLQENGHREVFQIIEGINQVYMKMREMVRTAQKTVNMVTHDRELPHLYHYGILDNLKAAPRKNITPQIISNISTKNSELKGLKGTEAHFIPDVDKSGFMPHFLIADDTEVLFLVSNSGVAKKEFTALWTNYDSLVLSMKIFFDKLWESNGLEAAGPTRYLFSTQNLVSQP